MSFEQSNFDNSERQNIGDRQSNSQLNFVDIANENGGSLANIAKGSQTADAYLPNLSIAGMSGGQPLEAGGINNNELRSWQGGFSNDSALPTAQSFQGLQAGDSGTGNVQGLQSVHSYLSQLNGGAASGESGVGAAQGVMLPTDNANPTTLQADMNQIQQDFQQIIQGMQQLANEYATLGIGTPPPSSDNPTPAPTPIASNPPMSDNSTPPPPSDNPTPAPTPIASNPPMSDNPSPNESGNYSVVNGTILGPNGQPFDAKGVAVYASQSQSEAATILQQMPNLNFIRLASTPANDSPAAIQADIQAFQSINPNVVVEVEDHTSGGTDGTTNNTLSGQDLTNEENWYAQIAAANVNNPNVWFGTANEPNDPFNEQNVVDQESGIYSAIRGAGNNNMVLLEADGGGSFGPQQADPGAYASMTNVAWDDHYYGWVTHGDTSVADNVAALQNEVAGANGITESNGSGGQQAIPTIIGEYGDSTDGQSIDANGAASVDAVQTSNNQGLVQGAVAWTWNGNNEPNNSDALTQDGTMNTVTPYGQEVIAYNNTGNTGSVT
jgi:hypothetical protein